MNTKLAFLSHAAAILFGGMAMHYYKRFESTNGEASFVTNRELRPGGRPLRPGCAQDADMVARFGPQLCQNAIQAQFDRFENHVIETGGLQNFLQPDFSPPLIDTFSTKGRLALTYEQVQSVCITKCQKDSNCGAVEIAESFPGEERSKCSPAYTGKSFFRCVMVNPALGPGAYLKRVTQDQVELDKRNKAVVTFVKKSGPSLTSFEDIACNIDVAELFKAVNCRLGQGDDCDTLLTADFEKFVAPGIFCVFGQGVLKAGFTTATSLAAQQAGGVAVSDCFGCLSEAVKFETRDICPISATDNSTIILDKCGDLCFPGVCESDIATGMLCISGAPPSIFNGNLTTAIVNGPDFTCPSFE